LTVADGTEPRKAPGNLRNAGAPFALHWHQRSLINSQAPRREARQEGTFMKWLTYSLILGTLPLLSACEQSVHDAAQDVREAQESAAQRVAEEQRDVEDAAKRGADEVIKEQREVEDAARAEQEKVEQEKRELEDAERRAADKPANP
jgi:hypothetical protein